jgi:phosphoglucomutase
MIDRDGGYTPTPVISRAILVYNRDRKRNLADGVVVTPSHNPPEDGGLKYNPPHGGPADTEATGWIENRSNELLRSGNVSVKRVALGSALKAASIHEEDFIHPYVNDLSSIVDIEAIRAARLSLAVDPLGGAALPYWEAINSIHKLDIAISIRPSTRHFHS